MNSTDKNVFFLLRLQFLIMEHRFAKVWVFLLILLESISFVCMFIETVSDFQKKIISQKKKNVDLYAPMAKIETINARRIMSHKLLCMNKQKPQYSSLSLTKF